MTRLLLIALMTIVISTGGVYASEVVVPQPIPVVPIECLPVESGDQTAPGGANNMHLPAIYE